MWTWMDGMETLSSLGVRETGDTITTAASTAADSLNSEGSSHYEGAHFGERSFDFSEDSPQTERVVDRNEEEKLQSSISAQLLRLHH